MSLGDSPSSVLMSSEIMIDKDSWGHSHLPPTVRGEILEFVEDGLLRKHVPSMFSWIQKVSEGIEDDQIPI